MSARTARDVIEEVLEIRCEGYDRNTSDAILSALRSAGFAPPMHTGAIHKALQDAFQMGGIEAVQTLDRPDKFIQRKHRYSDAALNELLKAAQEDSRG